MKKLTLLVVATAIATTAFFSTKAQVAKNSIAKSKTSVLLLGATYETTNYINNAYKSTSTLSKASARAFKDFAKNFKSATNANWYDDGEGGFLAYFKDSVTTTRVNYNKKGNWVYTVAMYTEQQLPSYVAFNVKFAFPTHTINSVQEIHYENLVTYIIHTEDKRTYKTLRYTDDGGVEEIEELQKQ